ncbi:Non-specific serine/threonine protein kinase protein [Dioscorea alata]|uniref:Non-specific serine/threonine protein kinase protein n=1 Tax=Dioscorea alata TaxID=55571 RepID=A0ACB7U2P9_DIOAL|nr:Non-specific serine/threonine protein kinase protein [Dioscorea alata]
MHCCRSSLIGDCTIRQNFPSNKCKIMDSRRAFWTKTGQSLRYHVEKSSPMYISNVINLKSLVRWERRQRKFMMVLQLQIMSHFSCSSFLLCFRFLCLSLLIQRLIAQATTDPSEVVALNTILERWGMAAPAGTWNISGDPCSGAAIDSTNFEDTDFNPAIKCLCSFINNTVCHITQLRVYALDVVYTIPDELQKFTYLTHLKLDQNYFIGPLPTFIGNLTALQFLSVGTNALSGPLPKELGNLKNLTLLGLGTNKFSGSLPPELGNLTNLQQLYIDSCGASGEIPPALANLKQLTILWASDNNFTGKIPDFIGSWTNLTVLRMQGNSFQGPIPSNFANLKKLTDLRIGDLLSSGSSLAFISNLTSLSTLVLRNNMISDTIPQDFAKYTSLQILDLSFNNITGQLPDSLFNLTSLAYLFLGNNSLSGSLPTQKNPSLINVDLSYNKLAGSFPSWVSQKNLHLNLVANNFAIDDSNSRIKMSSTRYTMPSWFPDLSMMASDGVVYEADNADLTTASYFVTEGNKWAVSTVGRFADAYIINSLSLFQSTLDSELFQTARLSPSSLRYYGIGLQNGNYHVKLQFAEIIYLDSLTWKNFGRRVFDIYIQGNLQEKDFDLRKEAGGVSNIVVKNFIVPVTSNFLEIHFFWAGKGTCCVPNQGHYGVSVSAISVSPYDFTPNVSNPAPTSSPKKNNTGLVASLAATVVVLSLSAIVGVFILRRRQNNDDEELVEISTKADTFTYAELRAATGDFNYDNKLGEGGFGSVFKGKLNDGRVVAVKQLSEASRHGKWQFMTEIATISAVQHRNLVNLYGCCIEGNRSLLVYEYLESGSLDQSIFEKKIFLDWPARFEICLGTARGLAYLHEESRMRIVHRDVKASNILLDANLNPKISDFGLAKLYDDKKTHISTRVAGTIGYLAPEYAMRGHLTEKADVFGFGVVALEVVCGRRNTNESLEPEKVYLLEWAWHQHERKCELEMVDPMLQSFNKEEVTRVIGVAFLCTQASPALRPPMSRVVAMLSGDIDVNEVTSRPSYLTDWHSNDTTRYASSSHATETSAEMSVRGQDIFPSLENKESFPASPSDPILHKCMNEGR